MANGGQQLSICDRGQQLTGVKKHVLPPLEFWLQCRHLLSGKYDNPIFCERLVKGLA